MQEYRDIYRNPIRWLLTFSAITFRPKTTAFSPYQHWLMSACCPLVVRLLSAFKADNKRTSSGQQADNNQCWSLSKCTLIRPKKRG